MKQWRPAVPGFDDGSGGITRSRACAGERNAKLSRDAGIRIGHVHHRTFVPAGDDAKSTMPLQSVVEGNVMNADNSKYRIDADPLQLL